ncbi:serine hydrolase [Kordiimonas sp.]|uniref:serine hydrolase n=1 Tax=Kordiimonas sp. TaxID=1970157 RepID=UPI003A8D221F
MRSIIRILMLAAACSLAMGASASDRLLITNAKIVDGTGAEAFSGDVLVENGVIKHIYAPGKGPERAENQKGAGRSIDAAGRVLAPGFIDLHTHGDPQAQSFENFLAMGVTTVTLGMDGSSDSLTYGTNGLAGWKAKARAQGLELNVIPMSGHGTLRRKAGIPDGARDLTPAQTKALQAALSQDLAAGSFGLSMGLEYVPGVYADASELKALGDVITDTGAIIMSHMRSEDDGDVEDAIDELVAMAPTGRVHISHLKVVYGRGESRADDLLAFMAGKRETGTRLSADAYPYAASYTGIGILFPEWALPPTDYAHIRQTRDAELVAYLAARIEKRGGPQALLFGAGPYAGQTLASAAKAAGKTAAHFIADLGPKGGSAAHFVMDRRVVDRLVSDASVALSTDGSPTMRHPRGYGTYARLIEYYVMQQKSMSLEAAVHKATGLPAEIMHIRDRGIIKPGMVADLILFDPAGVRETTSYVDPHQKATGFDMVIVGGTVAFENNTVRSARAGRVLSPAAFPDNSLPHAARLELDGIISGELSGAPEVSGLQVVVLKDGKTVFDYAGGLARTDGGKAVALTPEHKVRVASISKLVATIGLLRLVETGAAELDSDVSDYLGFPLRNPNFPDDKITLRMLLSHTSSIRDGSYYWLKEGEDFQAFFQPGGKHYDGGAHFAGGKGKAPGDYFTYANLNFGIIAGVIERVSGQRFDIYMHENVLAPLGLNASYNVCDVTAQNPDTMATLFRKRSDDGTWQPEGDWVPQLDSSRFSCFYGMEPIGRSDAPDTLLDGYIPGQNPTLFSPQGGLRASARDLAEVATFLMNGGVTKDGKHLLDPQTISEMVQPVWLYDAGTENGNTTGEDVNPDGPSKRLMTAYGLSVHIVDLKEWGLSGETRYLAGHLGDAYGLMGQFWIDFYTNTALVALMTGTANDPSAGGGTSPLYRAEEEVLRWWLRWFGPDTEN